MIILKKLETYYLSLLSIHDGINFINKAVREAYIHIPVLNKKFPRLEHFINLLFHQDASLPSFTNFILCANMIKYRRFLEYSDLIVENAAPVISRKDWECKIDIYQEIQKHLWEQEQKIKPMLHYYDEVFRMVNYMPMDSNGEIDYVPLSKFWDRNFGIGCFSREKENISVFSLKICELILGPVQNLLSGKVKCEETKVFQVFSERTFSGEFNRIEIVRDSLIKLAEVQSVFPRTRFIQLKQSRRGSIPNEAAIIQKISIILSAAQTIVNELIAVMKGRLTSNEIAESYPMIDSLMIRKGGFFLPYENRNIVKPKCFDGLNLPEALQQTITNILSLSLFLEEHETVTLITREKKLKQKIIESSRLMRRLANPEYYQQLREMYHLDLFGL